VIFNGNCEPSFTGIFRHPFWHGPAFQYTITLQPEIKMVVPGKMFVQDEPQRIRTTH
jgi:hypothetical protein